MKNRGRFEVTAAILKALDKGETRTKIMYTAMLSSEQCKLYLDSLVKSGLVHEVNRDDTMVYEVTPKAVKFLSHYNRMKELLPVVSDQALTSIIA
jgi:predicted transcriptional regulator